MHCGCRHVCSAVWNSRLGDSHPLVVAAMTIPAGKLRHRITFQINQYQGQDPITGEEQRDWQDVYTCQAAIEPLSARDFIAAQAVQSRVTARITIRHKAGIDAAMRIVQRGKNGTTIWHIAGVLPDPVSGLSWITLPVWRQTSEGTQA